MHSSRTTAVDTLGDLKCVPCRGDAPRLTDEEIIEYSSQVPEWKVVEKDGVRRLERVFRVKNFAQALAFSLKVGELAEQEDHHPVLLTEWGKVSVTWWTHAIGGLHRNDFIMAAKSDVIYQEFAS